MILYRTDTYTRHFSNFCIRDTFVSAKHEYLTSLVRHLVYSTIYQHLEFVDVNLFINIFSKLLAAGYLINPKYINDIFLQVSLIMLIGLAAKNAILMVEFSKEDHATGTPVKQAALNGAKLRYRAVLMTAVSFLFGVVPLVIATGSGAASRVEIGVTTFFGMLLATVFGIFMVPGLYAIFARMRDWTAAKVRGEVRP